MPAGAWVIHVVLILFAKILLDVIPGMPQDLSWTIVNLGYIAVSDLTIAKDRIHSGVPGSDPLPTLALTCPDDADLLHHVPPRHRNTIRLQRRGLRSTHPLGAD